MPQNIACREIPDGVAARDLENGRDPRYSVGGIYRSGHLRPA